MPKEILITPKYRPEVAPEIIEYYERVCERGGIEPGEVALYFNSFLNLPLESPFLFTGFMQCPAGLASTDKRLWIAHLPFDKEVEEAMWGNWDALETGIPQQVVAIGVNSQRLDRLIEALKATTRCVRIERRLLPVQKSGLFRLSLIPESSGIVGTFAEEEMYTNNVSFFLETSSRRSPSLAV